MTDTGDTHRPHGGGTGGGTGGGGTSSASTSTSSGQPPASSSSSSSSSSSQCNVAACDGFIHDAITNNSNFSWTSETDPNAPSQCQGCKGRARRYIGLRNNKAETTGAWKQGCNTVYYRPTNNPPFDSAAWLEVNNDTCATSGYNISQCANCQPVFDNGVNAPPPPPASCPMGNHAIPGLTGYANSFQSPCFNCPFVQANWATSKKVGNPADKATYWGAYDKSGKRCCLLNNANKMNCWWNATLPLSG